jgi:hypothetical protein
VVVARLEIEGVEELGELILREAFERSLFIPCNGG